MKELRKQAKQKKKQTLHPEIQGFYVWGFVEATKTYHRVFITPSLADALKEGFEDYEKSLSKDLFCQPDKLFYPPEVIRCEVNFPFLTDLENRLLTKQAQGNTIKKIARAFSGGYGKKSYNYNQIKYRIRKAKEKIREYEKN